MKKYLLLVLLLSCIRLAAQEPLEVKRVSLDSLVSFLNREFPQDFYCVRYAEEHATFTVSAPRERFRHSAQHSSYPCSQDHSKSHLHHTTGRHPS